MPTKAKAKAKPKPDPEQNTGKPEPEVAPLIEHSPLVFNGHAHVKGTRVTIQHALRTLARNHLLPDPRTMPKLPASFTKEQLIACLEYAALWMESSPSRVAELKRLREMVKAGVKST